MNFTKSLAFTLVALTTMLSATEENSDRSLFLKGELKSSFSLSEKKLSQNNHISIEAGHQNEASNSCLKIGSDMTSKELKLSMLKKLYFTSKLYEDHGLSLNSTLGLQPFTDAFFFKGKQLPHNIFTGLLIKSVFENDYVEAYIKTGLSIPINADISDIELKKGIALEAGIDKILSIPAYLKLTYANFDKEYQPLQLAIGYKDIIYQLPYDFYIGGVKDNHTDQKVSEVFANLSLGSTKEVGDMSLNVKGNYLYKPQTEINYSAKIERKMHEHLVFSLSFDKSPHSHKETLGFTSSF
jgi:hypothetical protein